MGKKKEAKQDDAVIIRKERTMPWLLDLVREIARDRGISVPQAFRIAVCEYWGKHHGGVKSKYESWKEAQKS